MKKNSENKVLETEKLKQKYGENEMVGVVKKTPELMETLPKNGMVKRSECWVAQETPNKSGVTVKRVSVVTHVSERLEYMPRYLAETDETYLQPICYTIVKDKASGKFYCTKRLNGGDERLIGARSIGIGGHVDKGESLHESMYRELKEEVGVNPEDVFTNSQIGVIYSKKTAVNRVHLGLIFLCTITRSDIESKEQDKLVGEWVTLEELGQYHKNSELESWSNHIYEFMTKRGI